MKAKAKAKEKEKLFYASMASHPGRISIGR